MSYAMGCAMLDSVQICPIGLKYARQNSSCAMLHHKNRHMPDVHVSREVREPVQWHATDFVADPGVKSK
jgi:hypothetical protein